MANIWNQAKLKRFVCPVVTLLFSSKQIVFRYVACTRLVHESKMCAWQIHSYGEKLLLSDTVRVPKVRNPDDVLVDVRASSVNPIDIAMMDGYGAVMFNIMRQMEECNTSVVEFPLSFGRDFSGHVISKGFNVSDVNVGDEVWGVVPPHHQGCHAERIIVNKHLVRKKPSILTHVEAGSLMYSAMTAWSSLIVTGDLFLVPRKGKRVLVLGGSGGVGTIAVQLLKAWGAQVVVTCRTDAVPLVESLGANCVIDYTHPESERLISEEGKYDIILDAAGIGSDSAPKYAKHLKDMRFSKYITLSSPLLRNVDSYGFLNGMLKNVAELIIPNIQINAANLGSTVRWGFFIPSSQAIKEISLLTEEQKIVPVVDQVFSFNDLPLAYEKLRSGHARGKIVIDMYNRETKLHKIDKTHSTENCSVNTDNMKQQEYVK